MRRLAGPEKIGDAFSLRDRVALVTGAGSPDGIGFACAKFLAGMGAHVAMAATTSRINDRAKEFEKAGFGPALPLVADLTIENEKLSLQASVNFLSKHCQPIIIIPNNIWAICVYYT